MFSLLQFSPAWERVMGKPNKQWGSSKHFRGGAWSKCYRVTEALVEMPRKSEDYQRKEKFVFSSWFRNCYGTVYSEISAIILSTPIQIESQVKYIYTVYTQYIYIYKNLTYKAFFFFKVVKFWDKSQALLRFFKNILLCFVALSSIQRCCMD